MAYSAIKAKLLVHAQTAAASVTPAIEDVQIAYPLPRTDCVRLYYGGEADPPRFDGRLTGSSEMVGKITRIGLYLIVESLDEELARTIDTRAEAFGDALRTAINANFGLDGACDNTMLEDGQTDFITFGNARFVRFDWNAISAYIEYPLVR